VFGLPQLRPGAGNRRIGVLQLVGGVRRAAAFAVVTVLVVRTALRAFALDETIGQEHLLERVVILLDGARLDQAGRLQAGVDFVGAGTRLVGMGRVVVVETDVEAGKVARMLAMHAFDQRLRRDSLLLGTQHDRRAMRVVGADVPALMAAHFLEAYPDVGLNVLDQMTEVDCAVGIRQGGSDENLACHWALAQRGKGGILPKRPIRIEQMPRPLCATRIEPSEHSPSAKRMVLFAPPAR
jgi:hypothetical protein